MQIELKDLSFRYTEPGSEIEVLQKINLQIEQGEIVAIIGPSGSGKSTLLLHLNGLLKPTEGTVLYKGQDINSKGYDLKGLRREIGFLFQFPEANLFGQTVYEDIAYGPQNHGCREPHLQQVVSRALEMVGLDHSFMERSPFTLSGGEKRRIALAGVLATGPEVLVLDEPTVGLDPESRASFLALFQELNGQGMTIIMVSHDLREVSRLARRIVVISGGRIKADGPVREVLTEMDLASWGLEVPEAVKLGRAMDLTYQGRRIVSEEEAIEAILARGGKFIV